MKRKIFRWVSKNLFGRKEGEQHPKWLLILFFPIMYHAVNHAGISFDFFSGVYTIEGVRFSPDFFTAFASELEEGTYFRFLKRNDGTVCIERIEKFENLNF